MLKFKLITAIGFFLISIACIGQVSMLRNQILERDEFTLIGPENVDRFYPEQSDEYINKYVHIKEKYGYYKSELEEKIEKLESKKIKNSSKIALEKGKLNKAELEILFLEEMIDLWEVHKMNSQFFYQNIQTLNKDSLNCYDFVVGIDTIDFKDIIVTENIAGKEENYYELINGMISSTIGEMKEEDREKMKALIDRKISGTVTVQTTSYKIYEKEFNEKIESSRGYDDYIDGKFQWVTLELDDPRLASRIERSFPLFIFDYELLEMYREIKFRPTENYFQFVHEETGKPFIPENWIKTNCE